LLASLPAPTTKAKILSFLSLTGYLRAWVPKFSLMAKPLYEASTSPSKSPWAPLGLCQVILKLSYKPYYKPRNFTCQTSLAPFSFTFLRGKCLP
jgi:hypothetical protein